MTYPLGYSKPEDMEGEYRILNDAPKIGKTSS